MKETELTYEIFNSIEKCHQILLNQGFQFIEVYTLNDRYFSKLPIDTIKETSFQNTIKNSFLLRNITDECGSKTYLVYKNKEFDKDGNVISEEKIKTKIDNFDNTLKILESANFKPWASYTSVNYIYEKDDKCIDIQDVKDLGLFLEIEEFDYMKNMTPEQKIKELQKFADSLGLSKSQNSSINKLELYVELILKNKNNEL